MDAKKKVMCVVSDAETSYASSFPPLLRFNPTKPVLLLFQDDASSKGCLKE